MPTNYPTSLDSASNLPDVSTGGTVVADETDTERQAIIALETKVGVNSSAVTTTLDYQMENHAHTTGADDGAPINTSGLVDAAVTYAKMQDVSAADRLLGRGNGGGSGDVQEISLGSGLSMSGTTLSASVSGVFPQAVYDFGIIYNVGDDNFDVYNGRTGTIDDADNATWNDAFTYVKTQLGTDHTSVTNGGTVFFGANETTSVIPVDDMLDLYNCYGYTLMGPGDKGGYVFRVQNVAKMQGVNNTSTTITEALDASETGIDITSAAGVPDPATAGYFYAMVAAEGANEDEDVRCTSRASLTMTVDRGVRNQNGGSTHASGATIFISGWKWAIDARGAGRVDIGGFKLDCNNVQGCGGIVQERRTIGPGGPAALSVIHDNTVYNYTVGGYCQGDVLTMEADEGTANCYWGPNLHAFDGFDHASITDEFGAFTMFQNDWHIMVPQVNRPTFMFGALLYGGTGQLFGGGGHIATGDRAAVAFKAPRGGNNTQVGDNLYLDNIAAAADEYGILIEPPTNDDVARLSCRDIYMNGAGGLASAVYANISGASQVKGLVLENIFATGSGSTVLTAIFDTNDPADVEGLVIGSCHAAAGAVVGTSGLKYFRSGVNIANTSAGAGWTPRYDVADDVRTTTMSKTSDITPATVLSADISGNYVYKVSGMLFYDGGTTGDMRLQLLGPSGSTGTLSVLAPDAAISTTLSQAQWRSATAGASPTAITTIGCSGAGTTLILQYEGTITLTTGGTVALQFAQSTSNGTATRVFADSTFHVESLNRIQV